MSGEKNIDVLLRSMSPKLQEASYVFCTSQFRSMDDIVKLAPLGFFKEEEGNTLILEQSHADNAGLDYAGVFRQITLSVHSSLEAVGLTAAVSKALAEENISANVVAAYFHDHIFVPAEDSERALSALLRLGNCS